MDLCATWYRLLPHMPRTAEDIENFLLTLGRRYDADGSTFLLHSGPNEPPIALRIAPPIVAVHATIGSAPANDEHKLKIYERLLQLNATDLMHASYGLEDGRIVLSAALALENLDVNELEATLSDIDVALLTHTKQLHQLAHLS